MFLSKKSKVSFYIIVYKYIVLIHGKSATFKFTEYLLKTPTKKGTWYL